jgi:hypothetical protein
MRARVVLLSLVLLGSTTSAVSRDASAQGQDASPSADADAKERSRAAFRKGVAQLRVQDWSAARASFETAWGLFPHPSILLNLGIARLRTDDPVHAEQDLVRFLSEDVGASPDELAGAREALAEARSKLGTLKIVVSPPTARVSVDGKAVETVRRPDAGASGALAEVRTKPGRHAIAVDAEGHGTQRRDAEVAAKGEAVMTITLVANETKDKTPKAAVETSQTRTVVGWSLVGLAGAALITSGITALRAKTLSDEYSSPDSSRYQDAEVRSDGITFRTTADVALLVALSSGAAAVILLFTDIGKPSSTDVARVGVLRW